MESPLKQKTVSANRALAITTLSHMMQHIFVGMSVLYPTIVSELKLSYTEFGLAIAISSMIGGLLQLAPSVLSRRFARHIILGVGNILLSIGTFLTSISRGIIDFLVGRIVSNIGTAPTHPMGTAILSTKFEQRKIGWALGMYYGLAYIGNIIGPIFITLLAILFTWRISLIVFSLPSLIVGVLLIIFLNGDKKFSTNVKEGSLKQDIIKILKTEGVLSILFAQVFIAAAIDIIMITTYTPIYLAKWINLDDVNRSIFYTIELVGGVLGPIMLGRIGARKGYMKTIIFSTLFAVTSVVLLALHSYASIILAIHLFFVGFFCFSFTSLIQSYLVNLTEGASRDLIVGIHFTLLFSIVSLWTAVIGYVIDHYSFLQAFTLMGFLGTVGLAILVIKMRHFIGKI
ncbi:MAG: MFS transporter [Nitrososphaeria archaeon]|nr:MFS transporter [Nitrososphaeria archaeon]